MRTINTTFKTFGASLLLLGLKGDSNATEILIDCAESLEEYQGTMAAMSITGPDDTVYPGDISLDENGIVHWVVAARDCGIAGHGSARVDLVDDEGTVVASAEARTIIMKTNMQGVAPDQIANWTEAASVALQEARAALLDLIDLDTTATTNEAARQLAETGRVSAETLRASAETARASAETARATAESARASAEASRATAENTRASAENTRIAAENARVSEFSTIEANAQAALSYIGPSEASSTASAAHAAGSYFIYNGKLYKATADIAAGDTITAGTNCAQVPGGAMGEVSELKSAFEMHDEVLETTFATNYEKVITLTEAKAINADGTLYDSSDKTFKHSKLLAVKPGKTYTYSFECGRQNFNFRVMGYTSEATDIEYSAAPFVKMLDFIVPNINSVNHGVFVIDDPSIAYVRFSGRTTSENFMINGKFNCAGDFISESIYTYVDNQLNEEYTNISLWENGTFIGQNPSASTTRIRTIDYFTADDFSVLSCSNNYEFIIVAWDKATGVFVGTWGANGTAFVTSGASSWVKRFDFKQFPNYKFKIALRNAVNTSATVAVSEAVNAVFGRQKYAPIDVEMHSHAGYTRLYSDITSDLVWQNKTITTEGISDSSTEVIAQLPSSGNVEVRMRYTTENSEFAVYQKVGNTITLMCDWTHYEFRYTGDYSPEYYVRVKTAATNNRDFVMKHCLVIYKYCDQGITFHKKTNMFGKKVAVFGDSIVQGKVRKNQASDVNSVTCKPWSSLIAEVNGDFNPHNFGIGGATVANAGTTTYPDWKSLYTLRNVITGFDIVFVCAGVNDYGAGIAEADFRTAYGAVLDALIANNTTVVVVTLCARSTNSANSAGLKPSDYADIEKEIGAAKNLKVIDLYSLTNNAEFKAQLPDGLHPNEIGHQIIANLILSGY